MINKIKNNHPNEDIQDLIKIEDIINDKKFIRSALTNIKFKKDTKYNIEFLLKNMEDINGKKLTVSKKVKIKRDNKIYYKDIYIIMNDDMKNNLENKNISQFFTDTTFRCVPPNKKSLKLWLLLGFDKNEEKTLLLCLALIQNETSETIEVILNYLLQTYNFMPDNITLDFGRGVYKAFKKVYPNILFVPCFFHYIQKIVSRLPDLKSKDKNKKKLSQNLVANIKLLSFIPSGKINQFYEKLKQNYYNHFKKFFKYHEKTYFKNKPFNDKMWNYNNFINDQKNKNINNNIIFFTNNITESTNKTINLHFIKSKKTFWNFHECLLEIFYIFKNKNKYVEKKISITRALQYYIENIDNEEIELIDYRDLKNIKLEYEKNLKNL